MEEANDKGEDFSIGYETATTPSGVYEIVCLPALAMVWKRRLLAIEYWQQPARGNLVIT